MSAITSVPESLFYSLIGFLSDICVYIRIPQLIWVDAMMFYFYNIHHSPSRQAYERRKIQKPFGELTQGKTPYSVLESAIQGLHIGPRTVFVDLGSGHGHLPFYMNFRFKVKSVGIDLVPTYPKVAKKLAEKTAAKHIHFEEADMLFFPLKGSMYFIAATCLSDDTWEQMTYRFEGIASGAIVISVSRIVDSPRFRQLKTFKAFFPWGRGTVYVQKKISS